ncbi:MAG: hypothetical protein EOO30_15540 [Comamonadaceae bacterium]|nr:MAG: hypothetical protein EOO30_15540 [Comamonadaceae bacterium]
MMHTALRAGIAAVLLALVALPPARGWLEGSMGLHMLVQFPLLALAGWLLARALPHRWRTRLDAWNAHGIAGLLFVALTMALLMIPRLLDLALADLRIDAAKMTAVVLAGAALQLSWTRAGKLVQGFFLGNVLPMTAAVGQLFQDTPLRLCNAYLLDDQDRVGTALVALALLAGAAWLADLLRTVARDRGPQVLPGA